MDLKTVSKTMTEKAAKAIEHAAHEFAAINTGKANPGMVEGITVEAYGSHMAIRDMAAITTPDARTIAIQPWDRSVLKAIEKAILVSNIGITPSIMGDVIRLPLPDLTGQRRQELVKFASRHAEDGRVAIRNARRDAMDALKKLLKDSAISEDDAKRAEKEIQAKTDEAIKKIGDLFAAKEKDLTKV